ncbi:TPA: sigma-70 family RNA polymerase sigma factor [Candidatus Poribacteria bacterium]|nr:sigma-70 family RNA polymerase sigma factor [Candidatus Poribacteria bacterium]
MDERDLDYILVKRFQEGDFEAFNELVRRYRKRVYEIAYNFTHNPDDALDLTQEIFLRVFKSLGTFRHRSSFYTWLYSISRNYCIDYTRRKRRYREMEINENMPHRREDYLYSGGRIPPPDDKVEREELRRRIEEAIDSLPDMQRQVFILRHYEGLSLKEIAKVLNRSIGTVKANLFHATRKLREMLSPYVRGEEEA